MHVLLLEPDGILGENYSVAMKSAGMTVDLVTTAQAAIGAADNRRPDCVVVELQLVEHSGVEFLYEFRSYDDWSEIPIVVQTHVPPAEFSGNWAIMQNELGVSRYIHKSHSSLSDLVSSVNAAIPLVS